MYRKSAEVKRREAIGKLLNNGKRFAVIVDEQIVFSCMYRYEAARRFPNQVVIPLSSLI